MEELFGNRGLCLRLVPDETEQTGFVALLHDFSIGYEALRLEVLFQPLFSDMLRYVFDDQSASGKWIVPLWGYRCLLCGSLWFLFLIISAHLY